MKILIRFFIIAFLIFFSVFWLLDYNLEKKQFTFKKFKSFLSKERISSLKNFYTDFIDIDFNKTYEEKIVLNNKTINYAKYSNKIIKNRYYLEQNSEKVFFISPSGNLFYLLKKKLLSNEKNELVKIKSNIKEIIGKDYIKKDRLIVKEILILEDEIFVSYLFKKSGCYSNAILRGKLNFDYIKFSSFLKIKECKKRFNWAVGGNLKKFKNNQILLTVGDYNGYEDLSSKVYDEPQRKDSLYGKILSINLETKEINILSMGHRNPQGVFYDEKEDIIYSTEHGPQGGDEINININPNPNNIKNYGWGISSYGEHYGADEGRSEKCKNNSNLTCEKYKRAPLYKSHSAYGFEEPFKYFTPSIGITEILKVKSKDEGSHKLLVASMGNNKEEGDLTLHRIEIDENLNEIKYDRIYTGERIRDIIDLGNGSILMSLESTGSFGILENIY